MSRGQTQTFLGVEMSVNVNMKELLEAGVHFGHQTRRWNPKMKHYIFGERNGVHIIDLQKTVKLFQRACDIVEDITAKGGHILFVGTKKQARDIVAAEARRSGQFFVNSRWLGGCLTNYPTIRQSIHRLRRIEKMSADGTFAKLPKKEVINIEKERQKLDVNLGGIKDMPGLPRAVFIIDAHKETIAIQEAQKLHLPIIGITDTNSDPTGITYPIPGNDDSVRSLQLFIGTIADACLAGRLKAKDRGVEVEKGEMVEAGSFFDDTGHAVAVEKVTRYEEETEE